MTFLLEPNESGSETDETEIATGEFVETSKDTTVILEFIDETFDQMSLPIEMCIIAATLRTSLTGWNDRFRLTGNNLFDEVI